MTISTKFRLLALPVLTAALLTTSNAQANDAPKVGINGVNNGRLVYNGPVRLSGSARDADGIKQFFGTIQNAKNKMFLRQDGRFGEKPARLPFDYKAKARETNWSTNAYKLPPGEYIFRLRVEDRKELLTEMITVPVVVQNANSTAATAATAATSATRPATTQQVTNVAKPAPQAQPATTVAAGVAANGMKYCSSTGNDADGDGFGWENNASCVVTGSKADKHPNCATAGSDPDGDGWGWENERSCIVVNHCQSAGSDPDGDGFGWENDRSCVVIKTSGKFPSCTNPASDPDGDGYGWENNKTCLVAK